VPALKRVASKLKLDYSQFLEVEVFTKFGTRVEAETQKLIDRGRALRIALKQDRFSPLDLPAQVAVFFLSNEGYLEKLAPGEIAAYTEAFIEMLEDNHPGIRHTLTVTGTLDDALYERLKRIADDFDRVWQP
jgi:F-type H+-transporting ATPase subunit alpha